MTDSNSTTSSSFDELTKIDVPFAVAQTLEAKSEVAPELTAPVVNDGTFVRVPLTKTQFVLVYLGLLLAIFLASLDQTIVSTALGSIVQEFGNQELIPWIGTAYLLTAAPLGTLYGKFADIFGRKWVFVFAIVVFELGSLLCAISTSMPFLIIARAVAGIGGGGIFSLVMIIVSDIVSIRDRGKYQGLIGAVFGLSSVIAPLLGGAFSEYATWRWCFYINLPLGAFTLFIVIYFLNFPSEEGSMKDKLARIDYMGAITLFAAIVCLITPLQLGGSLWAWNAPSTIVMFVLCPLFFALFAYIELRVAKEPIVPARLFVNRSVPAILGITLSLGACFMSGIYYISMFFQVVYGSTTTQAGIKIIPIVFGVVLMSIVSGRWVSKYGTYKLFFFIGPAVMIAGIVLVSRLTGSSSLAEQYGFLAVFGLGLGCLVQIRMISLQASVPRELIAIATGVGQTCNSLGSAIGIAVMGTIFNNLAVENMARDSALQLFVQEFNSHGIPASTTEVLPLLEMLKGAHMFAPTGNATAMAIFDSTLATAQNELVTGFNDAFRTSYLCLLPYPVLIVLFALFVKQFVLGKTGVQKTTVEKEEEVAQNV
ncbi:hypothetical protein HDU98_000082 [Podochytrium sp. JEL0797]|nr:hypothetical protein HDU98_000082 [Podochytrium sp. JEL0797]